MVSVKLHTEVEPYDLMLEIPESSAGLRSDGVKYWERVRTLKRGIRSFFPAQLANQRISELQKLSDTALRREKLDQADTANLDSFEDRALKDAASVRSAGLYRILKCHVAIAAIGVGSYFSYLALSFMQIWNWPFFSAFDVTVAEIVNVLGAVAIGLFGVAFGAIASAFLSSRIPTFETLERLGRYDLPSVLYVALLIVVFLLAVIGVWADFFDIEIANGDVSKMFTHPLYAFPLGLICGFAEPTISNKLSGALHSTAVG